MTAVCFLGQCAHANVTGAVFFEDRSCPAQNITVQVNPPTNSGKASVVTITDEHGRFDANLVEGEYYVQLYVGNQLVYGNVEHLSSILAGAIVLRLKDKDRRPPCGKQDSQQELGVSNQPLSLQFRSSVAVDWRPIDMTFSRRSGVLVLDAYSRVTKVSQQGQSLHGEVLFRLTNAYRPVGIAADNDSIFISASNEIGCNLLRYDVGTHQVTKEVIFTGNRHCEAIGSLQGHVLIARPELGEVHYWDFGQNKAVKKIDVHNLSGQCSFARVDDDHFLLTDGDGKLFKGSIADAKVSLVQSGLGPVNALVSSKGAIFVASGSRLSMLSSPDFKSLSSTTRINGAQTSRLTGMAIDDAGMIWISDSSHDEVIGPISFVSPASR
jgi:hypothetical protein